VYCQVEEVEKWNSGKVSGKVTRKVQPAGWEPLVWGRNQLVGSVFIRSVFLRAVLTDLAKMLASSRAS
jgi:hypothetical protein